MRTQRANAGRTSSILSHQCLKLLHTALASRDSLMVGQHGIHHHSGIPLP
jgi:hypothetical protein